MASETTHSHSGDMVCPDPSVHEKNNKLSEQASSAALYVTRPSSSDNPLGADGKLSSKSAATSLKYAKPQDLPSFPSVGMSNPHAANAAAMLAKDHKMKDLWQPEMSKAGSVAALKAHKDGGKLDLWQASPSAAGNSAATLAFKNKTLSPNIDRGFTDSGRSNSLMAATISAQKGRQRSGSTPTVQPAAYPDSHNSNKNALNAASVSHRNKTDGWDSEANQAARIQNSHMDKAMFGEHPPVKPELDEQRSQAALRASAVSMAKQMYDYQNRAATPSDMGSGAGSAGAETAHRRNQSSTSQTDIKQEAIKYIHLQDAAHKLAQEKLAKVDKDMESTRYRAYYGYPNQSPKKSRLSVRGRTRERASSEGQYNDDSDDEEQARKIRTQMSQLSTGLNTVDDRQRQEDRAKLMAAAEKRVHARMHDMDEKVFMETGKVSQSMMDEWEEKARLRQEKERAERDSNPGKTHIGGGKYMDQSEIEAIAAARLKPTLDEINDTAEKKRARDEEFRRERDAQETAKMEEKMKHQEQKAEFKRIRDHDKAAAKKEKEERKAAQRQEKEEAKARKSEEKRKSREVKRDNTGVVAGGVAGGAAAGGAVAGTAAANEDEDRLSEDEVDEEGGQEIQDTNEPPKEKTTSRGMFGRLTDRLKRRGEDEKHADEPRESTEDKHDEGAIAPVVAAATGAGVAGAVVHETSRPSDDPETSARILSPGDADYPIQSIEQDDHIGAPVVVTDSGDKYVSEKTADEPDEGAVVPGAAVAGAGLAAAGGVDEEQYVDETTARPKDAERAPSGVGAFGVPTSTRGLAEDDAERDPDEQGQSRNPAKAAALLAGVGAVGAGIAAAVPFSRSKGKEEEEQRSEVSSLSTFESDKDEDEDLSRAVTSPDHSGDHNFATASLAVPQQKRPDIERHISTIETSEDDSEALDDSEDEDGDYYVGEAKPVQVADRERVVGQQVETAAVSGMPATQGYGQKQETAPVSEMPATRDHPEQVEAAAPSGSRVSQDYPMQSRPTTMTSAVPAPIVESTPPGTSSANKRSAEIDSTDTRPTTAVPIDSKSAAIDRSPVSPLHSDDERNITVFKEGAAEDAPHMVVVPRSDTPESGAPAPAVRTGPSKDEPSSSQPEKEHRGVRGLFSKLVSRPQNKLHKKEHQKPSSVISDDQSEKSFKGLEKPTKTIEKDETITPVTTTSAGRADENELPVEDAAPEEDVGTGPGVAGIEKAAAAARADSPSSFRRYDKELNDLDDVSSSGVEEEDVALGRRGRLAKRLGLSRGKGKGKEKAIERADAPDANVSDTNGEDDQFEEARDHFDESLAPPPAFAGQAKSGSPSRETKFQEEL